MASTKELSDYLREHLSYELMMLRFTLKEMRFNALRSSRREQLLYNAFYEAFAVHARTLKEFLKNDGMNNVKIKEYISQHEFSLPTDISNLYVDLNSQVFHQGKRRPEKGDDKVKGRDCEKIADWIEVGMREFTEHLEEPFASVWKSANTSSYEAHIEGDEGPKGPARHDERMDRAPALLSFTGPGGPAASSHSSSSSTSSETFAPTRHIKIIE